MPAGSANAAFVSGEADKRVTVHLVTFSDESMMRSAGLCVESGLKHGADQAFLLTREWLLTTDLYRENKQLLDDRKRGGGGYFAWKPYVILHAMKQCQEGDILIYSDAGVEFIGNQKYIIDRMDQDVFLFGNMWEHAHWCKRDVVEEAWPSNRVETRIMLSSMPIEERVHHDYESAYNLATWARFGKQCQASVIFLRVSDYSRKFVKEWLDWSLFEGGRLIDDSPSKLPNHPEFQEHRWDQAILTTLAYREGIKLHWWPAVYNRFVKGGPVFTYEKGDYADTYPPLYHHHRRRDHEWVKVA